MVVNNRDAENERLMRDGQAAAKRGDKALARALLTQLLESDPHHEQAWVWLSGVVTDPQEQQTCLENALIINPKNAQARKGLKAVAAKTGIEPRLPALEAEPAAEASNGRATGAREFDTSSLAEGMPEASQVMGRAKDAMPAEAIYAVEATEPERITDPQLDQSVHFDAGPFASMATEAPPGLSDFSLPDPASGELPPWEAPGAVVTSSVQSNVIEPRTEQAAGNVNYSVEPAQPVVHAEAVATGAPQVPVVPQVEALPFDVAPFQPSPHAEPPAYTGGPPAQGMPPDMSNAVPGWVLEVARKSGPLDPNSPHLTDEPAMAGAAVATLEPEASVPTFDPLAAVAAAEANHRPEMTGMAEFFSGPQAATPQAAPPQELNDWLGIGEPDGANSFPGQLPPTPSAAEGWAEMTPGGLSTGQYAETTPQPAFDPNNTPFHGPFNGMEAHSNDSFQDPFAAAQQGANPLESGPFGPGTAFDLAAMGPYTGGDLPLPSELPGEHHNREVPQGQPWYLENANHPQSNPHLSDNSIPDAPGYDFSPEPVQSAPVPTIPCPNCRQHVPETTLNCPECTYAFFVHCPHCHELIDTSDARAGVNENCPYCSGTINKMELGLINMQGIKMARADATENSLSWTGVGLTLPKRGFHFGFGWMADLFALVVIVLMVWVLAQLPMWFNWTHLYN
ncbi:MAG: hypothetical protein ACJ78Q_17560 [Chloroflexia bacterium]